MAKRARIEEPLELSSDGVYVAKMFMDFGVDEREEIKHAITIRVAT